VLLLADDAARADDAQPAHGPPRREAAGPHHVERDEGARAAQARHAVHRHDALGAVHQAEEAVDDVGRRGRAVLEEEVVVGDAVGGEVGPVVLWRVEADDGRDADLLEDVDIVPRAVLKQRMYMLAVGLGWQLGHGWRWDGLMITSSHRHGTD